MERSEYSKKLEQLAELRRRKAELEHKKKMLELTTTLDKVTSLSNQFAENLNGICTSADVIIQNQERIEELCSFDKPHIPMSSENAKQFCEMVSIINDLFSNANRETDFDGLDCSKYKEFPKSVNKSIEESKRILSNCQTLLTNVKEFQANNNKINDDYSRVMASNNPERRQRRSVLSENSFMNTFQCNNVSASSPI